MWTHNQVPGWFLRAESFRWHLIHPSHESAHGFAPPWVHLRSRVCAEEKWKSRMRRPSWYLTVRNARFRPSIPTVLWSVLVAMKLTAGLRLDNIVWKRLSKRLSCWIWKFSFPARPGSKTLLVCLGSPAVLRTALRHSTFILSASVVPSCQAWQRYQAVQYVWSKLNFTSLCTVEKTEFNRFTAAIKSPPFLPDINFITEFIIKI